MIARRVGDCPQIPPHNVRAPQSRTEHYRPRES